MSGFNNFLALFFLERTEATTRDTRKRDVVQNHRRMRPMTWVNGRQRSRQAAQSCAIDAHCNGTAFFLAHIAAPQRARKRGVQAIRPAPCIASAYPLVNPLCSRANPRQTWQQCAAAIRERLPFQGRMPTASTFGIEYRSR